MMHLASALLSLGLAAGPAAPSPLEELPKAPVEIVLPDTDVQPAARPKDAAPPKPATAPKSEANVRILFSAPNLSKQPVPLPPPPVLRSPAPAAPSPTVTPSPAPPAAHAAAPKDVEVVASTSALPMERQPGYALIAQKCGRCHGVEKALNARFSADEWDAYLKKKYRRNGAGISPQQAEEINAFLRSWATNAGRP